MTYLMTQMLICLLIAFLLGLFLGWLLCKIFCKCSKEEQVEAVLPVSDVMAPMQDIDSSVDLDGDGYAVETLEGIGPQTGKLFRGYNVPTVGAYLRNLHSAGLREKAATDLGIKIEPIHEWASMSDLLRVAGIDHQYSELTYRAGVKTVGELASSQSDALASKMEQVNNAGTQLIAPTVPSVDEVASWIAKAKHMKAVVTL